VHFEQTYEGVMLEAPLNNPQYNVSSTLSITVISRHEDLEVDHADELT
jgi:hypothetical protein